MSGLISKISIGVGGLAVGALVVTGLRLLSPQHAKAASDPEQAAAEAPATVDTSGLEERLRRLESQGQRPDPTAAPAAAPTAQATSAPTQSPEQAQAEWVAKGAARQAQIAAEPRDPAWSKKATQTFRAEFEQLGAMGHFTVADLDCKTTSCMAHLRWGSYKDAEATWRDVMHAGYATRCSREVFAPVVGPDQADQPYEGSVYFDCTDDRVQ